MCHRECHHAHLLAQIVDLVFLDMRGRRTVVDLERVGILAEALIRVFVVLFEVVLVGRRADHLDDLLVRPDVRTKRQNMRVRRLLGFRHSSIPGFAPFAELSDKLQPLLEQRVRSAIGFLLPLQVVFQIREIAHDLFFQRRTGKGTLSSRAP